MADAGRAPRAVGEALGPSYDAQMFACEQLNLVLADTQVMLALYKKCHWPLRGPTFYQLHLLLDKHAMEQLEVVDALAERGQTRGGVSWATPACARADVGSPSLRRGAHWRPTGR